MIEIANNHQYEVAATFNNIAFCVKPGMTEEDGIQSYDSAYEQQVSEFYKTPEYAAREQENRKK